MHSSLLALLLLPAGATEAGPRFAAAAARHEVPRELLLALAWEASRLDPAASSAWGGHGLFDFQEPGGFGPDVERAATLAGTTAGAVRDDPELQVEAAAALLAWHGARAFGGVAPATADLEAWAPAVAAFSGRQSPELQAMFVRYVYEVVERGFLANGVMLAPVPVDHRELERWLPRRSAMPGGDYAGEAAFSAADPSNYTDASRTASDISYIVVHTVQGSYSGAISWFQNPSADVSAHYVVRSSDGQVTQCVWEQDIAWHAGNWSYNQASVGIEHEGYVEDPDTWYTDAMYRGSAALAADICARQGVPVDRSHIIGHYEVPGATHTDPGSGWDWDYYMALIGGGGEPEGATLLGVVADGDIYTGQRLPGALVTLDQAGTTTTSDADGVYRFEGLSAGSWSVTVELDGYLPGTCAKDVSTGSGEWWCSVALEPDEAPPPADTGPIADSAAGDTSPAGDTGQPPRGAAPPGLRVPLDQAGGCGCAGGGHGTPRPWSILALAAIAWRRRRSPRRVSR